MQLFVVTELDENPNLLSNYVILQKFSLDARKNPGIMIIADSKRNSLANDTLKFKTCISTGKNKWSQWKNCWLKQWGSGNLDRFGIFTVENNDYGAFRNRLNSRGLMLRFNRLTSKKLLVQSGSRVGVIEMLPRVDIDLALIDKTNVILKQHFERNLFSSITIYKQILHQRGYQPVAPAN